MRPAEVLPAVGIRRPSLGSKLLSQGIGNLGLNGGTFVLNFVLALVLSRLLGPDGYGAYAFAVSWALVLAIPALLGLPALVVREIAAYRTRSQWGRARALTRRANQAVLAASVTLAVVVAGVFGVLGWPDAPLFRPTLLALALIPLMTVVSIRQSTMQGFGAVLLGRVPEALVAPALTIAVVLALEVWVADGLSATTAVGAQLSAVALAALLGIHLLHRTLPREVAEADPRGDHRAWAMAAVPLFLMGVIQAVNVHVGTILTGGIAGSHEAGIYGVALRVSGFLPFLLIAAVPPLMPAVAELYARGDTARLQLLLTRAARVVFLGSVPIVVGVFVLADPILRLFGADFAEGVGVLRILCLGQLVNVATGFAGMILIMTRDAGATTKSVAGALVLNVALCGALVPSLGAEGAAIATSASVALANVLAVYLLWRSRRIYSPPFGFGGRP